MTDKIRTLQGRVVSDKMEKSIVRPNCTYMTRTTNAVSVTWLKSANAVRCPRLNPGRWFAL